MKLFEYFQRAILFLACLALHLQSAPAGPARTFVGGFEKEDQFYSIALEPMTGVERLYWLSLSQYVQDLGERKFSILRDNDYHLPVVGSQSVKSVKLSKENGILISLDANIARENSEDDLEDFRRFLVDMAIRMMMDRNKINPSAVVIVFDGYDYEFFRSKQQGQRLRQRKAPISPAAPGMVVVSAGHGLYKLLDANGAFVEWRYQRSEVNSVLEDTLTPKYADELKEWLVLRSEADVLFTRNPSTTTHNPTNGPWRNVSARYNLQVELPNNPEVWNSTPNPNANSEPEQKHRNQDIRSRPLYANYLGADALISLHSNASTNSSIKGGRVYYDTRMTENANLARHIGCYMKSFIQAKEEYESFEVTLHETHNAYGELRFSDVPSVIVEIAYHTNASDAAFLLQPAFRKASMQGVERGWRSYKNNQLLDCAIELIVEP